MWVRTREKNKRLLKKELAGNGGEEERGTTWKKRTSGGEREQTGQSLVAPSVWVQCRSTSGQCPVTNVGVPSQKPKKKLGDQERQWPCLAVFGWQLASGTARLEGDLQLVKSVRGTSLTVALDRQLQIPDTTAQPALEQGQPRHFRQP